MISMLINCFTGFLYCFEGFLCFLIFYRISILFYRISMFLIALQDSNQDRKQNQRIF